MAVNITDSVGYEGTVDEPQWARLMAYAGGRQYGVVGVNDWKVSAGTADREVRIAPGSGFGSGVLDRTVAEASLVLPSTASGSRWHLIAVRRDWQNNLSSFDSIAGPTGAAALPTRAVTPGTSDDQPLALVQVTAGQSQIAQNIDLRAWGGDGGYLALDELALQYLNRLGSVVRIGAAEFTRVVNALGNAEWSRRDAARTTVALTHPQNGLYRSSTASPTRAVLDSGRVSLEGLVVVEQNNNWEAGNNYPIGSVPASLAPAENQVYTVPFSDSGVIARLVVQTSGNLMLSVQSNFSGIPSIGLAGVSWRTK